MQHSAALAILRRMSEPTQTGERTQLHLVHPYKLQPRDHPQIRAFLEQGYRIEALQRVSDHELLVTLVR